MLESVWDIRPATLDDVAAIVKLAGESPQAPRWSEPVYVAMLHPAANDALQRCLLVLADTEGVAGFAVVSCLLYRAELESLVVSAAMRRRGLARMLCAEVVSWCKSKRAEALELEVRASNDAAHALYDSLGFAEIGSRPNYYSDPAEDAVLMRLVLRETA